MSGTPRSERHGEPDDVLLIDDNQADVDRAKTAFDNAATNVELRIARSREAAIDCVRGRGDYEGTPLPDLVLLDLELEDRTGYEVLRTIRDDPDLEALPVIVLTNSTEQRDIVRSYEAEANAYLQKPDDADAFAEVVAVVDQFWLEQVQLPPLSR